MIKFRRKNLPDDGVDRSDGNTVIHMNALLTDFDPLMDMVTGDLPVAIEFMGESDEKGRAYLKSLAYVFPGRKPDQAPLPPTEDGGK